MNIEEAGLLLAKIAGYDNRTVGDANILAWHEALADVDLRDALAAVADHFRESTDYLMPVHVRTRAAQIRRDRQARDREAQERRQLAAYAATAGPLRDRSADVRALVQRIRTTLPDGDPTSLRRKEWVRAERRRRADDTPNPYYQGPPPPGGWPVPDQERDAS